MHQLPRKSPGKLPIKEDSDLLRFAKRAAVAIGATSLAMSMFATTAHAVAPPNGVKEVLNGPGSNTTYNVMGAITHDYNVNATVNPDPDIAKNPPPVLASGQTYHIGGDTHCGPFDYNAGNPPPNGSSNGINALVADSGGCVDYARSSRGKSPSDPSSLNFYAYARDAVTWVKFSNVACPGSDVAPAGCAPKTLTQDQIKGIYLCTEGGNTPLYTDWSQVGGDAGAIHRYLPQAGSGTLSFFETKILGLSSAQQGVLDDSQCTVHPTRIEENEATSIASADHPFAISTYSFADWKAQRNAVVPDLRNGANLGWINGVKPTAATVTDGTFLGIRYVYNVAKNTSPSINAVLDLIGVTATGNGYLCDPNNATAKSEITKYGFVPLASAPAGTGLPNSACRKNPTPL